MDQVGIVMVTDEVMEFVVWKKACAGGVGIIGSGWLINL